LRTSYRGNRAWAVSNAAVISEMKRQCHEKGDFGHKTDLSVVTPAWHTDADLGRPIELVPDMSKSRKLGFLDYQVTDDSFFDIFARLREARVIP
jgi:hypothetical protein